MHGGDANDPKRTDGPLATEPTLEECMKSFPTTVRWDPTYCVQAEDEWRLQTSHGRSNRLGPQFIPNKQPVMKGIPALNEYQARVVAETHCGLKAFYKLRNL